MKIYNYSDETGELTSQRDARVWPGREHLPDENISKYQIPAHATTVAPPSLGPGQTAIFLRGGWQIVPDHRGETWYSPDGVEVEVTKLGDPEKFPTPLSIKAPPAPPSPPPTAESVRDEASRRMQLIVGARDHRHLDVIVSNATREAVRLLRKGQDSWTQEEALRATALEQVDAALEDIRSASNALEAAPPLDYADDRHWP